MSIDSPADVAAGRVVLISGTLSVISLDPPFVHAIEQVNVQIGDGPVTPARVSGALHPGTFPRAFCCVAPLPPNTPIGHALPITVTVNC